MRWDWYSGTVPDLAETVLETVAAGLSSPAAEVVQRRARNGYDHGVAFRVGGRDVACCYYGGMGNRGWVHLEATGDDAEPFARVMRAAYPNHRVTRFDSAQDYDGPGTWDRLAAIGLRIADEAGLKVTHVGDWHRGQDGRTLYFGSRKSDISVRLYEKGKQLGSHLLGEGELRADWCRLEVQVRPKGDVRYHAATVSAEEAWGFSRWSRRLILVVDGCDVARVNMQKHRLSDCEQAVLHMIGQYGPAVERLLEEKGLTREQFTERFWELIDLKARQRANRTPVEGVPRRQAA